MASKKRWYSDSVLVPIYAWFFSLGGIMLYATIEVWLAGSSKWWILGIGALIFFARISDTTGGRTAYLKHALTAILGGSWCGGTAWFLTAGAGSPGHLLPSWPTVALFAAAIGAVVGTVRWCAPKSYFHWEDSASRFGAFAMDWLDHKPPRPHRRHDRSTPNDTAI